ncbi:putative membrane-anchored protein [Saccharolobus shibatae B12]|uniref:Membrane-anchored protein n=1 Tax=Saccharolobus shibatae (strain ATCC 51178 / DSM 5389 / JCM 8931 / NBRC 15437 / B12) TaxID=523848 RepID=A0A8F5BLG9_SACSH|nr:hypothetical protein [Saccharolobus shibatae]QXJ27485.1 putative membrane-anchored protein [Saccharolobus shibatae B12]
MVKSKALSNVISVIILIFVILLVFIPFLYYLNSTSQSNTVTSSIVNNYVYLKNLQISQVTTGHPSLYYNGSSIYAVYSNRTFVPPSNLTIVGILYLNTNGIWVNVTSINYPLVVSKGQVISLPSYIQGRPIIIVTSLGNIFFLEPGSSIGLFATASKGGVEVLTQIYISSKPLSVSTNVTTNIYGTYKNFATPIAFSNQSGTFVARLPQYVFYQSSKGQIITGVFHNWIVLGMAQVNSTISQGIKVTLEGQPLVLIGNYSLLTSNVSLNLQVNSDNNINSNIAIEVSVNGVNYNLQGTSTITVPAGYVNITIFTLQANDTTQQSNGIIRHYMYSYSIYNGNVYRGTSFLIFVPPGSSNPTVYLNYKNDYNYYKVYMKDYNYLNNQVCLILNSTVYNYNNSYWIIGGSYTFNLNGTYSYNGQMVIFHSAQMVIFKYSNGTSFTYTFPNIPSYVIINQPMNITVSYNIIENWEQL